MTLLHGLVRENGPQAVVRPGINLNKTRHKSFTVNYMTKPDFSGTWRFNAGKSSLEIPPPDSSTFLIAHRGPHFHLLRTHIVAGKSDKLSIDLPIEGGWKTVNQGGVEFLARLYWEGDSLVFDSAIGQGSDRITNVVRYTLSEEGKTLIAREHLESEKHTHDNTWVFDGQ